jgi:uncharacterized membrane protein
VAMASDRYIGYMVVGLNIAWFVGYGFFTLFGFVFFDSDYVPIELIILPIFGIACGIILFLYGAIKYLGESNKKSRSDLIVYPGYNHYSDPYPMYHQRSREMHKRRSKKY